MNLKNAPVVSELCMPTTISPPKPPQPRLVNVPLSTENQNEATPMVVPVRRVSLLRGLIPGLIFALLLLIISFSSMRQKGVTSDEVAHLPAGYTYLVLGDFRLNPEHPPLIKILSGLPLLFLHPQLDLNDPTWNLKGSSYTWETTQWTFGQKFLHQWNDGERLLFWGRVPIVLLSLLLGLAVYLCAWDWYGWKAGCFALALYLFNPDMLAHGQLVTTDLGLTCFLFVGVYAFQRALRRMTVWNVLLAGLAVGLALVVKFSGVLIFPMLALISAVFVFSSFTINLQFGKTGAGRREISSRLGKLAAAAVLIAVTGLAGLATIWASYGFHYRISPDPQVSQALNWKDLYRRATPSLKLDIVSLTHNWRLVPEAYSYGFLTVIKDSTGRFAFLRGETSPIGFQSYFLVTFLVKTTLPLILLIGFGVWFIRRDGMGWANEAILLVPASFYYLVAISTNLNIGHRHILPIYPFLIVFASKVARAFDSPRSRVLAVICALLLAWNIGEAAFIYPHFLAYFNEIAGGPAQGRQWLVDSNLDWGQDLKGLAKYRQQHPEGELYLCYFGNDSPKKSGIKAHLLPGSPSEMSAADDFTRFDQIPPGATVAVSATYLQTDLFKRKIPGAAEFMARLRHLEPIDNIGYSIFIYRLP